ncbi:uncharacterized protein LOC115984118 [Quercus lobata]|uniref:uncharacterized protein LOC115984118 n=1 Tax=Quercus lobata TaxID=97700 RepID=UPI001247AC51|nr:uncharacterized protein LOC115984118 [Quercus lobata]
MSFLPTTKDVTRVAVLSKTLNSELSLLEELRNGLRSPLLSLKHLRVQLFSSSRSLPELLDILLCLSPYLETMCITSKYKENFEELNLQFQNKTAGVEEDDSDFQWNSSWKHDLKKVIIYKFVANNDVQETVVNFFLENDMKVETISDLKGEKYLCSKIKQH